MKKVLLTGENSYVGNSLRKWVTKHCSQKIKIESISVRGDEWIQKDFSEYDTVVHLAGLVHQKKEVSRFEYYSINTDLTLKIAHKAKAEGVKHFIFFSTMNVYGINSGVITDKTIPNPNSYYGKSKLKAEKKLLELESDKFMVQILRPPLIYGPNCPGNYARIVKLSKIIPFFPEFKNQRSMIYIDNLSYFLEISIMEKLSGIFFPTNKNYISTLDIVVHTNNHVKLIKGMSFILNLLVNHSNIFAKVFGSLVYDKNLTRTNFEYYYEEDNIKTIKSSIRQ